MPSLSFKPDLLKAVLEGRKTETRRLVKTEYEYLWASNDGSTKILYNSQYATHRIALFWTGSSYAVVPGRGQHQVGRVTVTNLRIENLFDITQESVDRECFGATPQEYIERFQAMYEKPSDWNPKVRVITFKLASGN